MAGIGFSLNYDVKVGNGLGPRTRIYSLEKGTGSHTQASLDSFIQALTTGLVSGTSDAVTVAGIAGTVGTDPLYIAVQGTGAVSTASGHYLADHTLTLVADFDQNPA